MRDEKVERNRSINSAISNRISETLNRYADRTLISDEFTTFTGREALQTMKELESYVLSLSAPGTRVGLVMHNSSTKMLCILAILRMGRIPVIFNANENYAFLQKQNRLGCLLSDAYIENNFKLPYPVAQLNCEAKIIFEYATKTKPSEVCPTGSGLILFTSGSSGEPKGVFVPEEGILYSVDYLIQYFGLNHNTRATVFLPTSHSMGLNTQLLPTFFAGGECILVNTSRNLSRIYRTLLSSKGSFLGLIGDMLRICHEEKRRRKLPPADCVRHIQLAGGIIHRDHLKIAAELFPNAILHKGYGMTEATRVAMINSEDPAFWNDTAGYVWPGQKVEIRGSNGEVLPANTPGQIHIQGPNVTLGYDRPGDKLIQRGEFFPSGDIGSFDDDGRLTIIGRSDSIFKINGERVSAKEIERLALKANFCVRDVKCLPFDGPNVGRAKAVLFLEIPSDMEEQFLNDGKDLVEESLKERMESNRYLPREILILNRFPRTPNGKLRAGELKDIYQERFSKAESIGTSPIGVSFRRLEVGVQP